MQVALAARNNSCRASELAGLPKDSISALEFDLACSLKLTQYDNERERNTMQANYVANYIANACAQSGKELPDLFEE